jgi:hypothetical protein
MNYEKLNFILVSSVVMISLILMSCSDTAHAGPNDLAANIAASEELRSFSWVQDANVSAGHLNIGVFAGEKVWGAPMITLAVCATLERNGSNVRRVRFVDILEVASGKSPRQAEIIAVDCPKSNSQRNQIADDPSTRFAHPGETPRHENEPDLARSNSDVLRSPGASPKNDSEGADSAAKDDYELISTNHNNTVENFNIWFKGPDLGRESLSQFATQFTQNKCHKPCNLSVFDKDLPGSLVSKYPLRGAEYIEVADHFVAYKSFDSPNELSMWIYKDSFYDETKARLATQ